MSSIRQGGRVPFRDDYSSGSAKSAMQCTKGLNNGQWKSDLFAVGFLWKGIRISTRKVPPFAARKGFAAPPGYAWASARWADDSKMTIMTKTAHVFDASRFEKGAFIERRNWGER